MPDLILRPSSHDPKRPWALQVRCHESLGETEYVTLCRVSDDLARDIIKAGAPTWLFGEPDWAAIARKDALRRAKELEDQAAAIRANNS